MAKVYADKLFAAMKASVRQQIETHNDRFPSPEYRRSYPARIKPRDETCLWNILRAWAAQAARDINAGQHISNRVFINNRDVQDGKGDKSNVGRWLSKFGLAGIVGARRATESDPVRYRCQFSQRGKGFGWVPVKRNRGTLADYVILINPALIPFGAIPNGTPIFLLDEIPQSEGLAGKVESFKVSSDKKILINEEMSIKARLTPPSVEKMEEGQAPQAETFHEIPKEKKESDSAAPTRAADLRVRFRQLMFEGKELAGLAMLLVASYFEKLVPAMGKTEADYVARQFSEGVKQAERLLAWLAEEEGNDLEQVSDALLLTIDRMQQAITHSPTAYAAPPGKWFNPDHPGNITVAYQKYLIPWGQTNAKLADLAKRRKLVSDHRESEAEAASKGDYYALAYSLKKHLMRIHKTDSRLRRADLQKWAYSLQLLCKKDKVPYAQACKVAKWWLLSDHKEACFFRSEIGADGAPGGIRSARGFRRNWLAMEKAYEKSFKQSA